MKKLRFKLAKVHDSKNVFKLFQSINKKIEKDEVESMIQKRRILVFKHKKKVIAAVAFSVIGFLGFFDYIYVGKLAVAESFRGKGIGTILLSKIKHFAVAMGASGFFLYSLDKAKKFYIKNNLNQVWNFFWWRQSKPK